MFKVTEKILCRKLLMQREKGIGAASYFGLKWFISKTVLIIFTIILLFQDEPLLRGAAFVGSGYLLGMIAANVRSFIILKNAWPVHKEFIDWNKVEQVLETEVESSREQI